jgi:hypothetical protein
MPLPFAVPPVASPPPIASAFNFMNLGNLSKLNPYGPK